MSLAFTYDETLSASASMRKTATRKAAADLAFILAFVAFAVVSIVVVATRQSNPDTEAAIAAFAEL